MTRSAPVVLPLDPVPDPLDLLDHLQSLPCPALLDGANDGHELGRYTYLTADPVATIDAAADDWPTVRDRLRASFASPTHDASLPPFRGGWIGWLGYELARAFLDVPVAPRDNLGAADLSLALYDWVIAWDRDARRAWLISTGIDAEGRTDATRAASRAAEIRDMLASAPTAVSGTSTAPRAGAALPARDVFDVAPADLAGDFDAAGYEHAAARVIEHILDGDLFQANLSQRFTAAYRGDPRALHRVIRRRARAALGAYLPRATATVLSASPELFLRYDATTRRVETRPIKGTRPRDDDPAQDAMLAAALETSEKDRAENVMIVDLMRNDVARVSEPASIEVPSLCRLESHAAVHHLVSTVHATLRADQDALDLIAATFPAGSITGAPKRRAIEVLATLEPVRRGVYCGAIGWIGLDGSLMLSVAIRTVTLAGGIAAVHAGGGVTARSVPHDEYLETLDKARLFVAALAEPA